MAARPAFDDVDDARDREARGLGEDVGLRPGLGDGRGASRCARPALGSATRNVKPSRLVAPAPSGRR